MGNVISSVGGSTRFSKEEDEGSSVDPEPKELSEKHQKRKRTTSFREHVSIRSPLNILQIDVAWDALRQAAEDHLQETGNSAEFTSDSFDIENDLGLERPVKIAILDTGVNLDHEALIGRVARLRNFVPRWFQEDATDDLQRDRAGRGTFLAALAVGGTYSATSDDLHSKDPAFRNGVAPFAKLVIGKVLSDKGKGDVEWLVKGLKWACDIEKTDSRRLINADIICITSGVPRYAPDLRLAINEAMAKGKVIVCVSNVEEPGMTCEIHYPARFGDVICVSSHSDNGTPSAFSPPGRETEFLSPGEDIWSASSRGTRRVSRRSGPFVAVPYCAGICALVIAYAEKVGGQELRRIVTHTHVMKKILKRMSPTTAGTHHDPLSGFGNILPGRVLKYGSEFFINTVKDIFGVRDRGFRSNEHQVSVSNDPMKPTIREFNASYISTRITTDKNLLRTILRSTLSENALFHWYTGLEVLLTQSACEEPNMPRPELSSVLPTELDLVDFSMPPIGSNLTMTIKGINVERCIETYFHNYNGHVKKVILPEYRYVVQLDQASQLVTLQPDVVHLPGTVPVNYLMRVINSLLEKESHTDIIADILDTKSLVELYPAESGFIRQVLGKMEQVNIKVYLKEVIGDFPEEFEDIMQGISNRGSKALGECLETKFDILQQTTDELKCVFYSHDEGTEVTAEESTLPESARPEDKACFYLKHELTKIFLSSNRNNVLKSYPKKQQLLRNHTMRSYEAALYLLQKCNMADVVSCLDLRFDELNLEIPDVQLENMDVDDDTIIQIPGEMRGTSYLSIADTRTVSLSSVFKDISSSTKESVMVEELIMPPVNCIQDLADTMSSSFLKQCKNMYIPGQTAFVDLLLILRNLPREEYPMTIHVQSLRLTMSIGTIASRDFECPPGVRIIVYHHVVDYTFLQVAVEKVAGIYEILLRFSSRRLLELIRENCQAFIDDPDDRLLPFNCYSSYTACHTLLVYIEEALREEMIQDDQSILNFSSDVFKFRYMTAATGPHQFRLAFKPPQPDGDERQTLSPNFYRPVLMENRTLLTKWRQGKLRDVVVAVFGLGINGFHPEFYSKPVRDNIGNFGDKIAGLAYNAVPEDCLQSFLDDDCTIGTVAAALIAGSTCGAAPFSKVISVKVGRSSGHCRPDWIVAGLKYLVAQEKTGLLPQSDIVFVPFTFGSFDFDMYSMVNQLTTSGKIIICASGRSSVLDSELINYPACYGDVICVGSHQSNGEPSPFTGKGRETDLLALGEVPTGGDLNDQWGTAIAAAHVTGLVAYILAYAETIGGPSLRQVISSNSVIREILRRMCSKPGQHDEKSGYGILNPGQILRHGDDFFRQMVSELTEEYGAIVARRQSIISHRKSVVRSGEDVPRRRISVTRPPTNEKLHEALLTRRLASVDGSPQDQPTGWAIGRNRIKPQLAPRRRGYSECSTGSGVSDT